MLKVVATALSVALLICGCTNIAPAFDSVYIRESGKVDISAGEYSFKADYTFKTDKIYRFCFTYPEDVAGLELTITGGKAQLSLGGITFSDDGGFLPDSSLVDLICELFAYNNISDAKYIGNNSFKVKLCGYNTKIICYNDGCISVVEIDKLDTKIVFYK